MKTMSAPLIPAAAIAPNMYLSVIFSVSPASHGGGLRLNSNFVGLLVLARRFFLPSPGRRLISIMVSVLRGQFLRRARPIASIRRGATSSVTSDPSAPSLTDIVVSGLASSTGFFRRCPSDSVRPGVRDPPPQV